MYADDRNDALWCFSLPESDSRLIYVEKGREKGTASVVCSSGVVHEADTCFDTGYSLIDLDMSPHVDRMDSIICVVP